MKIYKNSWANIFYAENEIVSDNGVMRTPEGDAAILVKELPENIICMDSGDFLIRDYGKYRSGICFISPVPRIDWNTATRMEFNLPNGNLEKLRGDYFVSKKGTKCFRVTPKGHYLIIMDSWGGAFNKYRGRTLPEDQLYYRRASSNGGGCGCDYAIVPISWRMSVTEDDI